MGKAHQVIIVSKTTTKKNRESTTRELWIFTRLIKKIVTSYKEDKKEENYVKHQRIDTLYIRSHQIHQIQCTIKTFMSGKRRQIKLQ